MKQIIWLLKHLIEKQHQRIIKALEKQREQERYLSRVIKELNREDGGNKKVRQTVEPED